MAAHFYEQDVQPGLKNKRKLSAYLDALVQEQLESISKTRLTYIFCNDAYLLDINIRFLQHHTLTDIITFDLSEKETELSGEIYISTERVAENALKFKVPYEQELHRVIFHGALHLCGYKDKSAADREEMKQMEDLCLREYFKD